MQSKSKHQLKNQLTHSDYQQANRQLRPKPAPLLSVLPNQLISVLNLAIPMWLYHYRLTIKALDRESVCLNYRQSALLNSINRLLIEYFISLPF